MNTEQDPQAQTEPEVVAYGHPAGGFLSAAYIRDFSSGLEKETYTIELLTLQSHREAMAGWDVTKRRLESQASHAEQDAQKLRAHCIFYREAIAKKDAALDACVEALGKVTHALYEINHAKNRPDWFTNGEAAAFQHQRLWESKLSGEIKDAVDAAITQAKEARK